MITLKNIINGQNKATTKSYNTDLFKSDSENITETFCKDDYEFICLIGTDTDDKSGLLKETIIAYNQGEAYLINTVPSLYNGEITVTIYQKWLTLQGFNFFIKENLNVLDDNFVDHEGRLNHNVIYYYDSVLANAGYELKYSDVLELGEYNSEYNCITLQFNLEEKQEKHFITINEKQQLSKITVKKQNSLLAKKDDKPVQIKSILG